MLMILDSLIVYCTQLSKLQKSPKLWVFINFPSRCSCRAQLMDAFLAGNQQRAFRNVTRCKNNKCLQHFVLFWCYCTNYPWWEWTLMINVLFKKIILTNQVKGCDFWCRRTFLSVNCEVGVYEVHRSHMCVTTTGYGVIVSHVNN